MGLARVAQYLFQQRRKVGRRIDVSRAIYEKFTARRATTINDYLLEFETGRSGLSFQSLDNAFAGKEPHGTVFMHYLYLIAPTEEERRTIVNQIKRVRPISSAREKQLIYG